MLTLKGKDGAEQIANLLASFRVETPTEFAGIKVVMAEDYKTSVRTNIADDSTEEIHLPKSNVLKYHLEDGSWVCLRLSGTEPKVKFYFSVKGTSMGDSASEVDQGFCCIYGEGKQQFEATCINMKGGHSSGCLPLIY